MDRRRWADAVAVTGERMPGVVRPVSMNELEKVQAGRPRSTFSPQGTTMSNDLPTSTDAVESRGAWDRSSSKDEEHAVVRASAQRHRADAEVQRMRAELARDDTRGTWARTEELLKMAYASLDAAVMSVDRDIDAAMDDLIAARLLLATALAE